MNKLAITVDDSRNHPGIVFFQDSKARGTVAVDRTTGEILGSRGRVGKELAAAVAGFAERRACGA
jgi:hypothetical protein